LRWTESGQVETNNAQIEGGGDVKSSSILITSVPPGEAPLWVREKWVGLELPVRYSVPKIWITCGILSAPSTRLGQLWWILRGRAERVSGYLVEASRAVGILERSSPEAAAWWHENAPQHVAPKRFLVFHECACRVVDA
jgi:hypothetical protein